MFPSVTHPVIAPLSTSFYNLFALIGIYPKLVEMERKISSHHLRYNLDSNVASLSQAGDSSTQSALPIAKIDPVSERRRAKAMILLDQKMAELSKESIGWDEVDNSLAKEGNNDAPSNV